MSDAAKPLMGADDFIAWATDRPEGERWELFCGELVAMAPERAGHARAKMRFARMLEDAVRRSGLPCEVFGDGMAIQVDEKTVYEPDVLLRCGPPLPDDAIKVIDPLIVVDIVSPSSTSRDTGIKLADYVRVPSLRHYVIVRIKDRILIHHARADNGDILTRIVHDGRLDFGAGLTLEDIFPPS
jgi:Uma2 family endonuclease